MERYCNFRSLIKYQYILGLINPRIILQYGFVFFGLSRLCILRDPGAVNQAGKKGPLKYFCRTFSPDLTDCNWVFKDEVIDRERHSFS